MELLKTSQHAASEHKEELIKLKQKHSELEQEHEQLKKGGGLNDTQKNQLKEFADLLTSGNQDFEKSLYLYTFMIKDHPLIIEEALKKTKEKMQDIERQKEDFESDAKFPRLIDFLKVPKKAVHEESDVILKPLGDSINKAIEELEKIKAAVLGLPSVPSVLIALSADFSRTEGMDAHGAPYSYLLQKLKGFSDVFKTRDVLSIKFSYENFLKDTTKAFEVIFQKKEKKAGGMVLPSIDSHIKNMENQKLVSLKEQMEKTKNALDTLSKITDENTPGNECAKYKIFFQNFEGNLLLHDLNPKKSTDNFAILSHSIDYFKTEDLKFSEQSKSKFKKNVELKNNFPNLRWVSELRKNNVDFAVEINEIANLRLTPVGSRGEVDSWFSDINKIDTIMNSIVKVVSGILIDGKNDKSSIMADDDFVKLERYFSQPVSDALDSIVDSAIANKKPKDVLLETTKDLYDAQFHHASLIEKLKTLKHTMGDRFKEFEAKPSPDLIEARVINLRKLCDTFEKEPYYTLDSDVRSETYVWTLDALASPEVLKRLGVPDHDRPLIIKALKDTHAAYIAVREAIKNFGKRMERKDKEEDIWNGFEMNVSPLKSFDVLLGASKGGVLAPASSGSLGVPLPPPPPPGGGVPLPPPPAGMAVKGSEIDVLKEHAKDPIRYKDAVMEFLKEVKDNWTKLDYAPTFGRYVEIFDKKKP